MFNFFKTKPAIDFVDRVWIDGAHKTDGIHAEIAEALRLGGNVLLVAFFDETLRAFEQELRNRGVSLQRSVPLEGRAFCDSSSMTSSTRVWLLKADQIESRSGEPVTASGVPSLYLIFLEHHPLASRDQQILESVAALPCSKKIVFHTALDEPIMERFGGERLRGLMSSLGHDPETSIEHPMISSSIRKAQEKIEKKLRNEKNASSADEWFRFNLE